MQYFVYFLTIYMAAHVLFRLFAGRRFGKTVPRFSNPIIHAYLFCNSSRLHKPHAEVAVFLHFQTAVRIQDARDPFLIRHLEHPVLHLIHLITEDFDILLAMALPAESFSSPFGVPAEAPGRPLRPACPAPSRLSATEAKSQRPKGYKGNPPVSSTETPSKSRKNSSLPIYSSSVFS